MPNTKQIAVNEDDFKAVIDHILKHYGHIGKFFGIAAIEKMERDIAKLKEKTKPE